MYIFIDGAFKKLKTEGDSAGMSVHAASSSWPTPARRRHRTTFTQVSFGKKIFVYSFRNI